MPALFSPRHYRFLAASLRKARNSIAYATDRMVVDQVIASLIADLARENPNFFSEPRFRAELDKPEKGEDD